MSELSFDCAQLNTAQRLLLVAGNVVEVQPLVFDLLAYFAHHPRRAISKVELLGAVWRSSYTSDSTVARAVMKARRAILDDATSPRLLRTVSRVGYSLDADVTETRPTDALTTAAPPLAGGLGTLAVLPFVDQSGDPTLAWSTQGLMGLVHMLLERSGQVMLAPVADVNAALGSLPSDGDRLAQACRQLGVNEALLCEIRREGSGVFLRAMRGADIAQAQVLELTGTDALQVSLKLVDILLASTNRVFHAEGDTFWQEQFARALGLLQSRQFPQALDLLVACRRHMPDTAQLFHLHASLLHECNKLDAAREQVELALRRDDAGETTLVRVQLQTLLARCDYAAERLDASQAHFERALVLAEKVPAARSLRPEVLCLAANTATRRGDPGTAVRLSEAAVTEATELGHINLQARAWLQLAATLNQMDMQARAEPAVQRAVELARRTGVVEHEARAWRLQANVLNYNRRHRAALDSVRRCIALWIRCGDVVSLNWARIMEILILIESDRLDEVAPIVSELSTGSALQLAQRGMLTLLSAALDWKCGRCDAGLAAVQVLAGRQDQDANMTRYLANGELVFMHLHLGRPDLARMALVGVQGMPTLGAMERRHAAVALAEGHREQALNIHRELWRSPALRGVEGFRVMVDLTWLLLEDVAPGGETPELESLFAHVLDLSEESLVVRLVRAAFLMRRAPSVQTRAQWDEVVAGALPIRLRHAEMATERYRETLAQGSPIRLRELISYVCW